MKSPMDHNHGTLIPIDRNIEQSRNETKKGSGGKGSKTNKSYSHNEVH